MIKRTKYLNKILRFKDIQIIKIINGIYGSGKSTLLSQYKEELINLGVLEEQIIMIDFSKVDDKNLLDYIKLNDYIISKYKRIGKKIYILCDEIQIVDNWERVVNSLNISIDCDIYLTISSDRFLTTKHSTYIAGRYITITVYPFSFSEFYLVNKEINKLTKEQSFKKYLQVGGMPYLSTFEYNDKEIKEYLYSQLNKIILDFLYKEENVKHSNKILNIVNYGISLMSQTSNPYKFASKLKEEKINITYKRGRRYIYDFLNSYMLIESSIEDMQNEVLNIDSNYYLTDHSFYNLFGNNNIVSILKNIVYLELKRRNAFVRVGIVNKEEIAFICSEYNLNPNKSYYMVCDHIKKDTNTKRIYNIYKKEFKNYPKYIISLDKKDMTEDGIKHFNIIDFLLNDE